MPPPNPPGAFIQSLYLIAISLALPIMLAAAWITFKHRNMPGAIPFLGFILAGFEMISMFVALALAQSPDFGFLTARLRCIGLSLAPVCYLLFAAEFTGSGFRITRQKLAALLIIPIITQLVVWDVFGQGLFFKEWTFIRYSHIAADDPVFTGWFWVQLVYADGLLMVGTLLLIRFAFRFGTIHRESVFLLIAGTTIIIVAGSSRGFVSPPLSLTPLGELILTLFAGQVLFRQKIFDVAPIACDHVFRGMRDGVIVLNNRNIVVQVNPSAESILHISRDKTIKNNVADLPLLGPWIESEKAETIFEVAGATAADPTRTYEGSIGILTDAKGHKVGQTILLRDITERKRTETALRQSEQRYRQLLENVPVPLIVLDLNTLDVLYINPFSRLVFPDLSASLSDMFRAWAERLTPADRQRIQEQLYQRAEQVSLPPTEYTAINPDGTPLHVVIQTVLTEYEHQPALLIAINNITDAKLALEAEAEQRLFTEALLDIASTVNSTLRFQEVLERVFVNLSNIVTFDWSDIMLIEGDYARVVGYSGYPETYVPVIQQLRFSVEDTQGLRQMVETCEPVIIDDTTTYAGWKTDASLPPVRSYLGVPIVRGNQVIGFINLDSQEPRAFTRRDAERLQALASQVAVAMLNAQLYERAQEDAAQTERQRLARELHDAVSQTLFSASVTAETLPYLMDTQPESVRQGLTQLVNLTRGALSEMRTLLIELRPTALEETELDILLTHLVNSLKTRTNAVVEYTVEGLRLALPTDAKIGLYRIAQEALNNVVKHSNAQCVNVHLHYNEASILLSVVDDGIGFDMDEVSSRHLGLRIMRERAATLGIPLTIHSAIDRGTQIEAVWKENVP